MDEISDMARIGSVIIVIAVIIAAGFTALNIARSTMNNGQVTLEKAVHQIEGTETVTAEEVKKLSDDMQYSSELIKDVDGNVVGIVFNEEGSESTNVITDSYVENADTVINADSYVENADKVINADTYVDNSIVNESQPVSYVVPVTIAIILGFVLIMVDKWMKYKKEKAQDTKEILSTPLETYQSASVEELKKKYM